MKETVTFSEVVYENARAAEDDAPPLWHPEQHFTAGTGDFWLLQIRFHTWPTARDAINARERVQYERRRRAVGAEKRAYDWAYLKTKI